MNVELKNNLICFQTLKLKQEMEAETHDNKCNTVCKQKLTIINVIPLEYSISLEGRLPANLQLSRSKRQHSDVLRWPRNCQHPNSFINISVYGTQLLT